MSNHMMLFDEQEKKLIQAYVYFAFGYHKRAREIVGKALASAAKKDEVPTFANGIAALITINETKDITKKAETFINKPKTLSHPVIRFAIKYVTENEIESTNVDKLNELANQMLSNTEDIEDRIDKMDQLLTRFVTVELAWDTFECPICHFAIPQPCIKKSNETICISCGSKLLFDKYDRALRTAKSFTQEEDRTIPVAKQDLNEVAKTISDPIEMAQLAQAFYNKGNITEGLKLLDEAVLLSDELEILSIGSKIYFEIGDYDKALELLEKLELEEPDNTQLLGMMAKAYANLGLEREAIARLKRIVDLEPDNERAIQLLDDLEETDYSDW